MPHESLIRSAGTAASESSTDWCVIACGTSISDSTPPATRPGRRSPWPPRRRRRAGGGTRPCRRSRASARLPPRPLRAGSRDRPPVLRMRGHAQVQRAQAAVNEEAVEWAGHGADRVLDEAHLLVQRRVAQDHGAADDVRVAAEVVRRGMDDGVAPARAALDHRVAKVLSTATSAAGALIHALDVHHVQHRVGRRLHPDQLGLGAHGTLQGSEVGLVDHVVDDAEASQHLVDQPVGAAVEIAREDHVIAAVAVSGEQGVGGRHAAREARREPALQLPEGALERRPGGVGGARVVVVLHVLAERRLHVGRGLVNRRDDRAVGGIRVEPGVDRAGGEAGLARGRGLARAGAIVFVTVPGIRADPRA